MRPFASLPIIIASTFGTITLPNESEGVVLTGGLAIATEYKATTTFKTGNEVSGDNIIQYLSAD